MGAKIGHIVTEETRKKISKKLKGRKGKPCSEENRKKIGEKNKINTKRLWKNLDYRKHMSDVHKGHIVTEKTKKKISESNKGKIKCESWRRNLSKSLMGINKGKKLKNQIVTHHINGNHFDNRPENRQLMTRSEHMSLHRKQGDI